VVQTGYFAGNKGTDIHIIQTENKRETAILVGVVLPGMTRQDEDESLEELALLADTAGAEVAGRIMQERRSIVPSTLIGSGKVNQIVREISEKQADLILFDCDLTPVQLKNLEKAFKRKVLDRSGLILDIFASRARSREAQIQVELAQLQYLLPRLTRQWTHLSRQDGGIGTRAPIGTRGPGETQLEVDRRATRRRIGFLKNQLKGVERQRTIRRKKRQPLFKVALIGYTNVGKSSLLNTLADAEVFVEDRLFATLDATIRSLTLADRHKVLLIDTVGFIRKLPAHLVASFRSTLEETVEADMLLHVVDISHPCFEEQIGSVQQVLRDLGIDTKPTVVVFNKVDRLRDRRMLAGLKARWPGSIVVSALNGMGLESLKEALNNMIKAQEIEEELRLPVNASRTISFVHDAATVLEKKYEDGLAVFRIRITPENRRRLHLIMEKNDEDANRHRG